MILRILLLPILGVLLVQANPGLFESRDFVEYWSASKVLSVGGDPYDALQLLPVQRYVTDNPDLKEVVSLWTPPWTLPLYYAFGFEPFQVSRLIWIGLQLLLIAISVELLWKCYGGAGGITALLPHLLAIGFVPVFWTVFFGQNTGFLLLGLSGFLFFRQREQPYLAGLFVALTALKPHVLAVFGVVLVLDALKKPGRQALTAGVAVIGLGAVVAVLLSPGIFELFLASVKKPESPEAIPLWKWEVPLLSYRLRLALAPESFWVQFVPCVLGGILGAGYYWQRRHNWDWRSEMPRLIFASTLLAPYGAWIFDLVVLLVPVMALGVALSRMPTGIPRTLLIAGFVGLFLLGIQPLKLQQFIWFAPAVLVWWMIPQMIHLEGRESSHSRERIESNGEPVSGNRVRMASDLTVPS